MLRNEHDQAAARRGGGEEAGNRPVVVGHVLEHVEGTDHVE